jgi:transcriptional regulator with XRE-family HTH domain
MAATPEQRDVFSRRLVELRTASGLKQKEFAQRLGVTYAAVSEYERGISAPSAQKVRALEDLFDEPIGALGDLLGYRGDDPATTARLDRLEQRVKEQQETLREILTTLERLDRGSP